MRLDHVPGDDTAGNCGFTQQAERVNGLRFSGLLLSSTAGLLLVRRVMTRPRGAGRSVDRAFLVRGLPRLIRR
jgi:hypothetical protein